MGARRIQFEPEGFLDSKLFIGILARSGFLPEMIKIYETPVSTVEDPPQTSARVSEPQVHEERPRHAGQPPSQRPQAPDAGLRP